MESAALTEAPYQARMCLRCGYVYDEATGHPEAGIPPGTRWDDVPEDWSCPDCFAGKGEFV